MSKISIWRLKGLKMCRKLVDEIPSTNRLVGKKNKKIKNLDVVGQDRIGTKRIPACSVTLSHLFSKEPCSK